MVLADLLVHGLIIIVTIHAILLGHLHKRIIGLAERNRVG